MHFTFSITSLDSLTGVKIFLTRVTPPAFILVPSIIEASISTSPVSVMYEPRPIIKYLKKLLPSATVVAERLCFHRRLSVHRGGGGVHPLGRHSALGRYPPQTPPGQTPPKADPLCPPPAPETATAADGTHPATFHSHCLFIKYVHTSIECRIFFHRNNSSLYSINCTSSCLQGFPSRVCCISYSFFVSAIMLTNKVSSKISKWVRNFKEDFIVHTYLFIQKSLANPGGALYQPNFLFEFMGFFFQKTRVHSSRMHNIRCSGRRWGGAV